MNMNGKRIVITGASGGLGINTVALLVAQGAEVIGLDKVEPNADQWKGKEFLKCDITNETEVDNAFANAVKSLGGIDILINNAGSLALQDAAIQPTQQTRDSFDDNFWALWKVTSCALPHLQASKGKLINVSSLFAYVNAPLVPGYATSKRAVAAFSDSIRMQYGREITVTTLYPGFINTDIHRGAVRQGLSVAKIVDIRFLGLRLINLEEPVLAASKGMVKACKRRYRDAGLTILGSLTLWFARHTPSIVDFIISQRVAHMIKQGSLNIKLDTPSQAG